MSWRTQSAVIKPGGLAGLQKGQPFPFLRLACSCLKYSAPRLAISFPPFRPSLTAVGSFGFGKIQKKLCLLSVLRTKTNVVRAQSDPIRRMRTAISPHDEL
jgi:hypothetical protein